MLPMLRNSLLFPALSDEFFGKNFLSEFFGKTVGYDLPAVNIVETGTSFEIEVAAPGFTKDDFKVDVHNNVLTISSQKEEKRKRKAKITAEENLPMLHLKGVSPCRILWTPIK